MDFGDDERSDRYPTPESASRAARGRRAWAPAVLVIDDEVIMRGLIQEFLVLEGYRVLCAGDGEEGLAVYRRNADAIDAVILDLLTPRLDGCDVFEAMRRLDPSVPIVLTSDVSPDDRAAALAAGAGAGFLLKPFTLGDLLIRLENVLDHAARAGVGPASGPDGAERSAA